MYSFHNIQLDVLLNNIFLLFKFKETGLLTDTEEVGVNLFFFLNSFQTRRNIQ